MSKRKKGTYKQYVARHKADIKAGRTTSKQLSQGAWAAYHSHDEGQHNGLRESHAKHSKTMRAKAQHHLNKQSEHEDAEANATTKELASAHATIAKEHGRAATHLHEAAQHGANSVDNHKGSEKSVKHKGSRIGETIESTYKTIGKGDVNRGKNIYMAVAKHDRERFKSIEDRFQRNMHAGNRHALHPAHPAPKVHEQMEKHHLHEEDADETQKFHKKMEKSKGQIKGDQWLFNEFKKNAAPETRKRMEKMNIADFMAMYNAIMDDEDGEGKEASLRSRVIRLAHEKPELRGDLLPLLKEARGSVFMFEKNDFGLMWSRRRGSFVDLYWPLENIGKRGRRVEKREVHFRCDDSNTAWAEWWTDQLKKAPDAKGANRLLTKLFQDAIKECDDKGWAHWEGDYVETLKGVDRDIPTPKSLVIEDIKGSDVSVSMNGREVSFSSISDDKKWMERGYQVYDLKAPKNERKKIDSVRDQLERAKGYDQIESILQSAKVRFKSNIRMDSMYL